MRYPQAASIVIGVCVALFAVWIAYKIYRHRRVIGLLFADLTGKPVTLPVPPTATTVKTDPRSGSVLLNSPVGAHLASDYFLVQTEP